MMSIRLMASFTAFVFFLVSCSPAGSALPEPTVTHSPPPPPTELPILELMITPDEKGTHHAPVVAEPTPQLTVQPVLPPTPTPAPRLRQLTDGGCCTDSFWSPDGQRILYIDRPSMDAQSGLWGVDLHGGQPEFVTDQLGIYSPDMQLRAFLVNGQTIVERLDTGEQWRISNDGRWVSFSPDGTWLAWTAGQSGPPFDSAERQVWVSRFDGSQERQVFDAVRGGFGGWFPDGRLLVSGLVEGSESEQAYWALDLDQSHAGQASRMELGRGGRLREAKISPDGSWLTYLVSFSQDPAANGIWLADTRSGERRRLEIFGGYHWRDDQRLLVVPLDLSQPTHQVLQVQAATGQIEALTDPALTPLRIANGDWSVSPQGGSIAFLSADDGNIWLLEIPES